MKEPTSATLTRLPIIDLIVIAVLVSVLAGFATHRPGYEKPGLAEADRKRDQAACVQSAMANDRPRGFLTVYRIDRDVYAHCMEERGYTLSQK